MTRRHITVVIAVELIAAFATGLVIVDLRAHAIRQAERDVNMWGYRGEPRLRAVDLRVAVVGGSAAFGYGVDWEHSLTYYLDGDLKRHARKINELLQIDVVNLAAVGDGAASYISTLQTYAYLRPNAVCIYDGFSGLGATGDAGTRRSSAVFRATGYFPILYDVMARREPRTDPARAAIDPLLRDDAAGDVSCAGQSAAYCGAIAETVSWVLAHGMTVAVVAPPHISRRHQLQQTSLLAVLAQRFGDDRRIRFIDMGRDVDVSDRSLSPDGVFLSSRGNQILAEDLAPALYEVVRRR